MGKERIEDIVTRLGEPLATELGYELVDVEYHKEGPDWILRCFIDSQTGIGITECQRYSEALSTILDNADPIPGSYLLEVSSPGLERPLKKPQDYIRFTGEQVEIKLHRALNGQKTYRGQLLGMKEGEQEKVVMIQFNQNTQEIPYQEIAKAHLIPEIFGLEGGKSKK